MIKLSFILIICWIFIVIFLQSYMLFLFITEQLLNRWLEWGGFFPCTEDRPMNGATIKRSTRATSANQRPSEGGKNKNRIERGVTWFYCNPIWFGTHIPVPSLPSSTSTNSYRHCLYNFWKQFVWNMCVQNKQKIEILRIRRGVLADLCPRNNNSVLGQMLPSTVLNNCDGIEIEIH